jgi:hypothetical protein
VKNAGWKKRLAQGTAGFVFATILAEVVIRLLGAGDLNLYEPNLVRGVAHRAGARGWFHKEGGSFVAINRDGFRDRERNRSRPPNGFRIAVLGDSYTEALQVPREATFCAVLERTLATCPALEGRQVEVLNFGVSDYGLASELMTLRSRVWDYSPDIVLVAMFTANDVLDSVQSLKANPRMPYFVDREGTLVLDDSFRKGIESDRKEVRPAWKRLVGRLITHSMLLQRARQVWGEFRARHAAGGEISSGPSAISSQVQVYRPPVDARWKEAWRVTEGLLRLFRDESAAHGATFGLVVLSNPPQVHPDPKTRRALERALGVPDLFGPDRRLQRFGVRERIPVLTLAESLRRHAETETRFYHGFGVELGSGHYNQAGHDAVGRYVAAWLCKTVIPEAIGRRQSVP